MRTVLFVVAGFLLLGASMLLGKLFSTNYPSATSAAIVSYIALWLLIAGFNMWVGVAKAGYSSTEELPIFLIIFAFPSVVAIILKWRFP